MEQFIREFNKSALRFKIRYQKDTIIEDDLNDTLEVSNAKKPDPASAQMRVFFKEAYADEWGLDPATNFSMDNDNIKKIFDYLKQDIIDLGYMKAFQKSDLEKNPNYFYLNYISQLHLESRNYDIKKIIMDEQVRISPDEPNEKLMANYMMCNFNQSFVSRSILSLERWEYTCNRCQHQFTQYVERIQTQLTVQQLTPGKAPLDIEKLIDKKFGIVDDQKVGRQFIEKCPKCKIYTLNTMFISLQLSPDVLMVDVEQIKPKLVKKLLKLVSMYNSKFYTDANKIEGDENKGLPVKLKQEDKKKVELLSEIDMNHDQINWLVKDIQGLIPREKKRRADERGLRDKKFDPDEELENDDFEDIITLEDSDENSSSSEEEEEGENEPIVVDFKIDMQKYLDPEIVEKTNPEIEKIMKNDWMLHKLDPEKQDVEFDDQAYPKLNWKANSYELFATIEKVRDDKFVSKYVAYVLKENGKQWYMIDEDSFRLCEPHEIEKVIHPEMQFYRKRNVMVDFAKQLELMFKRKNNNLGVYKQREIMEKIGQNFLKTHIKKKNVKLDDQKEAKAKNLIGNLSQLIDKNNQNKLETRQLNK